MANTNKYGYDSTADTVRMTIQRGAIYADHSGQPYRDSHCHYMDRGPQYFSYTLFAYTTAADAHRRAAVLQAPLRAVNDTFHHGPLAERYEGVSGCADNVIVTAIKQAEDGEGTVIRYLETEGKSGESTLHLLDKTINTPTAPYAIKTVDEAGNALNFMEWDA